MRTKGFTLFETLVAIGIFLVVAVGAVWVIVYGLRYNSVIWEQLKTQNEGRRALKEVVSLLRKAEESSLGGYPLSVVDDNEVVFYANVDSDNYKEKVRLFLENGVLKKGIIKPSGDPLGYGGSEVITEVAQDIINESQSQSMFEYYGSDYYGSGIPLAQPATTTDVTYIKAIIQVEKDENTTPSMLQIEGGVQIRNLKQQ